MSDFVLFVLYTALIFFLTKRIGQQAPDCSHQWGILHKEQFEKHEQDHNGVSHMVLRCDRYHLRCTKCGDMTKRDMK